MNDISTLVLFYSGATRSFVSLALNKKFDGAPGEMNCPLDFEIADDRYWGSDSSSDFYSSVIQRTVARRLGSHSFAWEQGH